MASPENESDLIDMLFLLSSHRQYQCCTHHSARGVNSLESTIPSYIVPARVRGWSAAVLLAMAPTAALTGTVFEPLSMQLVAPQSESLQQQ